MVSRTVHALERGQYAHIVKMYLILKKSLILYSYNTFEKKLIHGYDVNACPLLRFRNSWYLVQALVRGQYVHIMDMY